jgi:hypothetical protein
MAAAGREFAVSRFAANVMVQALERVYRDAWNEKPGRRPWSVAQASSL